jgi:hypothetical protein
VSIVFLGKDGEIHPDVKGLTESDSWPQVRDIYDYSPHQREQFTFLLIADGEHTVEGFTKMPISVREMSIKGEDMRWG